MFLFSLLDASAKTTETVKWISLVAAFLLIGVIAVVCFKGNRRYDAKHIAFAGICVSLSFILSLIKLAPVQYGGSITLASFVPILIYAYVYGFTDGLLVGLIHGLLNFVSSPYILTGMTFILDYLLAFASIGLMGFAKKFSKNPTVNVVLGTLIVYLFRFACHLVSGFIYFEQGAIWVEFPTWAVSGSFVYSFIYQCIYIPADCVIALIVLYALAKSQTLDKLERIIRQKSPAATNN